jgi:hypothetical protein
VMRLRAIDQLFDPVDPSPFGQQDLSQWAARIYCGERQGDAVTRAVRSGDRGCRADRSLPRLGDRRRCPRLLRAGSAPLRRLLRRGLITLAIGVTFLVAFFVSHLIARLLGDGPVTTLLREGSLMSGSPS